MKDSLFLAEKADIYRLLSCCFYEPDRELFVKEKLCNNLERLLSTVWPEAAENAAQMITEINQSSQEELAQEQATLFIGPFELLAPPYGSVYLEKDRQLMGDTTLKVRSMYNKAGLELDVQEPHDHIAFELEFMNYLCLLRLQAIEENRVKDAEQFLAMQKEFMTKYLSPWISLFCNDICQHSKNGFYIHLALCLDIIIASESAGFTLGRAPKKADKTYVGQTAH